MPTVTTVHLYVRQQVETDATNAHNITRAMYALQAAVENSGTPFRGSCESVDEPAAAVARVGVREPLTDPRPDA